MSDQKNTILAIALSALVLIGWQYFYGMPQAAKQREQAALLQQQQQQSQQVAEPKPGEPGQPAPAAGATPPAPGLPSTTPVQELTRDQALATAPRIAVNTDRLSGSISLKGGRIDDLSLLKYRETVDPASPPIELLAPSGSPHPFYAEFGWRGEAGATVKLPTQDTVWSQSGSGALTIQHPVTLTYANGEGLEFRRTISVDDKYLFTVKDEVVNKTTAAVTLYPYALISRHGTPVTLGYYILHEGMIGEMGSQGLQEVTYKSIEDKKTILFDVTNTWLGITDKYWAAALLPDTDAHANARFLFGVAGTTKTYQTDYVLDAQKIAPGATGAANGRLFAGAKEVAVINAYQDALQLNHFDLMIDWGYLWFITKPMFLLMDYIYGVVGNFGLAILMVTVLVKLAFFPLANKSYASMARMKAVQPEMTSIRARFPDDKVKQQQAMMELYKKEKINPVAGCLPIAIQIPVFFSLYKVLFITIEMRHAPFFGWIKDLASPDPTNLFTLFGLIPWDPSGLPLVGHFLVLGLWPLIMGVTMWFQMKLNPTPPDPTQQMIFNWMPVIFTFMLSSFPAGLVIYWAWNNSLSVLQQSVIMRRNGAKIELFDNLRGTWAGLVGLVKKLSGAKA